MCEFANMTVMFDDRRRVYDCAEPDHGIGVDNCVRHNHDAWRYLCRRRDSCRRMYSGKQLNASRDAPLRYRAPSDIVANAECCREWFAGGPGCEPLPVAENLWLRAVSSLRVVVDEACNLYRARAKNISDHLSVSACTIDDHLAFNRRICHLRSAPNFSMVACPCWLIPSWLTIFARVANRILRSSQRLQCSTYQTSQWNFCSQEMALRPFTWARPVIP